MKPKSNKVPKKMQARFEAITTLIDTVCQQHLDEEYAEMSRRLAAALARKRPSPLERGRANTWACGIVYALGSVNFLFDKSFPPYISAADLCAAFGVSKSTGGNKSKKIRELFDMLPMDPPWTLPSLMDQNPLAWMISVNGLMLDARHVPRHIQEEAFKKGLIPYIPGEAGRPGAQPGAEKLPFNLGESVIVKPGIKDPDFGDDLGGYVGRVIEIEIIPANPPLVTILWDSLTLQQLPTETIKRCEKQGMDWSSMNLYASEIEPAVPRDTLNEVETVLQKIATQVTWLHLGAAGERIQQVLEGIVRDDEWTALEAWYKHLEINLTFPFEAELAEFEAYGPIRPGDAVQVSALNEIFEDYGILVDVKKGYNRFQIPLADLEVKDQQIPQYRLVKDYAVWFANR